jgi:sarcosine oxidase subunit beta
MSAYDVIIIGAGSVGLPTACFLAEKKVSVLVIDELPSSGQGQNKAAIGGVRATHSDPAKIQTCQLSLDVFSTWKDRYGDDIHFQRGGYCFPVYEESDERTLKDLLALQHRFGLEIDWIDADDVCRLLPGIEANGLRGGTYSPGDGNISPIMAARAFFDRAVEFGAEFRFNEKAIAIDCKNGSGVTVKTDKASYTAGKVLNAAGAQAREVGRMMGVDLPVEPDSHEGGVTDAVMRFFEPLVVDIRGFVGSKNFYFYQEKEGHVVFCLTPDPIVPGVDRDSTSTFLPQAARRLIKLFPRLKNARVRRVWRGLYPMTPDGVPIVDEVQGSDSLYVAVGFCGQGLMLGPGIAKNIVNLMIAGEPVLPKEIFASYRMGRDFYSRPSETLK